MDYPKSVPGVGLSNGKFVDDNPITGAPGSLIPASWGNLVTDELLSIVQAGGLEPSEAAHDQLLVAIRTIIQSSLPPEKVRTTLAEYGITNAYTKDEVEALVRKASSLPVGSMVPFPKGTVPAGFLEADHSVQSIAVYPDLYAYLGTTFNDGTEPAGYFRLPESRGEFLRGWDHGRGVDTGRAVGTYQVNSMQGHNHVLSYSGASVGPFGLAGGPNIALAVTNANTIQAATIVSDGVNGAPSVAAETRPRNLAVMWCIKAWSAPINQANIDISALAQLVVPATEARPGTAKVATQEQVVAGVDNESFVTSKKLRLGFAMSLAPSGFVAFPAWLGGLVIQWGTTNATSVTFPLQFPANLHYLSLVAANFDSTSAFAGQYQSYRSASTTGFTAAAVLSAPGAMKWFAIGN
ncbi:Phage Tail Collar Domain [Pseudomonas asplenii]|uniref:Phage Tail Collar Domain n=1 Tax=Pseudomonas asplenii TaxID=53407 RepID=A0A1H1NDW1_9PSED|nr:phage tail protein [Pseudomonas asplenii]SDR97127.1 Phage Tail Collar Domain [Pseudomonas asplenii]